MRGPPLHPEQLRRALSALAALLPQDKPAEMFDLCCYHAPRIAEECGISPRWFDATPHAIRHTMLDGWREPTVPVGRFGPLEVRAIARIDLISLKLIAGRERDLNDLDALCVTADEARIVIDSLPQILTRGANPDSVDAAIALARAYLKRSEKPHG